MRRVVDEKKRFRLPMVISSVFWFGLVLLVLLESLLQNLLQKWIWEMDLGKGSGKGGSLA